MAYGGNVCARESQLRLDLASLDLTRHSPTEGKKKGSRHNEEKDSKYRNTSSVSDAVHFLQSEHQQILDGLHQQMQMLQLRCDDLQFDAHLRHLTKSPEDSWKSQLEQMGKQLEERTLLVKQLENDNSQLQRAAEEERSQQQWRELQLQQQLAAAEQKIFELRAELSRGRSGEDSQVWLERTSSGRPALTNVRAGNYIRGDSAVMAAPTVFSSRPPSRASVASVESLEGPASLEEGDVTLWKAARLGGAGTAHRKVRQSTSSRLSNSFSSKPRTPPPSSLPHLPTLPSGRPSSSNVTLPPITQSQSVSRPQVRRQLRLDSAAMTEFEGGRSSRTQ